MVYQTGCWQNHNHIDLVNKLDRGLRIYPYKSWWVGGGHFKIWAANTATLLGASVLLSRLLIRIDKYTCESSPGLAVVQYGKYLALDNVLGLSHHTPIAHRRSEKKKGTGSRSGVHVTHIIIFTEEVLTASVSYRISQPSRLVQEQGLLGP